MRFNHRIGFIFAWVVLVPASVSAKAGLSGVCPTPGAGAVTVTPADDVAFIVNSNPSGTTFVFTPGVYRNVTITLKDNDVVIGQPGAILNGSMLVSTWTFDGTFYEVPGVTQQGIPRGRCDTRYDDACFYPEDLFFNNVLKQRVAYSTEVVTGTWYLDYNKQIAYLADNPAGYTVEIGSTTQAIRGGNGVTICGLTVEKYASSGDNSGSSEDRAVAGGSSSIIENNEIRFIHFIALSVGDSSQVLYNSLHDNGNWGVTSNGNHVTVSNNEIYSNDTLHFLGGMDQFNDNNAEGGGGYFYAAQNLMVSNNYIHDNLGHGMHDDGDCIYVTYQGNRSVNNADNGFVHEISYDAVFRYNVLEHDAIDPAQKAMYGAAIFNATGPNVEVYNNTVLHSQNGIGAWARDRSQDPPVYGPHVVKNFYVHNNVIVQDAGTDTAAGIQWDGQTDISVFSSWGNHFSSNTYQLGTANGKYYLWLDANTGKDVDNSSTTWVNVDHMDPAGTWIPATDTTFPTTKFNVGDRVSASAGTGVWSLPSTTDAASTLLSTLNGGAMGTVTNIKGPILTDGAWWWQVDFDNGPSGWALESAISVSGGSCTGSVLPSTPVLNLSAYLAVNAQISASYTGCDPASYFSWSLTPVSQIPNGSMGSLGIVSQAPSASWTSPGPQTNLGSQTLGLGPYLVSVQVYDSNNNASAPAQAYVTLVPSDLSTVRVFPNPWRSDKHGGLPITFDNLSVNSAVKIFTVSGHWVKSLPMSSTSVTWDLTNDAGQKVASGLYVYLIRDDQGQKKTGQLAVIK